MKKEPVALEHDDRWLTRLLEKRTRKDLGTEPSGVCLDADTLAAWADHALSAGELAAAQSHVSTCARCLALLATIERTTPIAPEPERRAGRAWLGWLVPLTAAATALAIWVLIPGEQGTHVTLEPTRTTSSPPPPSALPPPDTTARAEVPAEPPPAQVDQKAQPSPSLRDDSFSARARQDAGEQRSEASAAPDRAASAGNAAADAVAPSAPAPPAAGVAAGALSESAMKMQRRAFDEASIIESDAPGGMSRWRVVGSVAVERSTDGGKTWARTSIPAGIQSAPPARTVVAIQAIDGVTANITTSDGQTYSTTDGGATWSPVQEKPAAPF